MTVYSNIIKGVFLSSLLLGGTASAQVSPESFLDVLSRLDQLEKENLQLNGQNEKLLYQVNQIKKTQKQGFLNIDERIDELIKKFDSSVKTDSASTVTSSTTKLALQENTSSEIAKPFSADSKNDAKVTMKDETITASSVATNLASKPEATIKQKDPIGSASAYQKETYQAAYDKIKVSPSAAMRSLEEYIKLQPTSPLAPNARYWIGEIKYKSRNYKGAIDEFVKVLQLYKSSNKAPDAAVKLGYSFYELKNWKFARRTFDDVLKYFPKNENAVSLAKARLKLLDEKGK